MLHSPPFSLGADGSIHLSRLVSSFSAGCFPAQSWHESAHLRVFLHCLLVSCLALVWLVFWMLTFQPMLCSGGLLMNFSYHFPSFPWSLNQPYSCWKFYKFGCKRPSEERVGTLPTCSASADLFEPPYKDTLWFVCKWTEEKSDLLES